MEPKGNSWPLCFFRFSIFIHIFAFFMLQQIAIALLHPLCYPAHSTVFWGYSYAN